MRSFRERFSTLHPVILRRTKLEDWGDTGLVTRKGFPHIMVRVNSTLSSEAQFFVLVHELAHALQWRANEDGRESDHDGEWGIAYARIWEVLLGA